MSGALTSLADVLASLKHGDEGWRGAVPTDWLQGRTAFGGFSAAIALHAAKAADTGLPPLRSAQISFVGPLAGSVTITARLLRRGRNAAFVEVDVTGEAGLGLRAMFVFVEQRESAIDHAAGAAPAVAAPGAGETPSRGDSQVAFSRQFETLERRDPAAGAAEFLRWTRLAERDGLDPEIALIATADALPPAALRLGGGRAPVSSMTWLLNLLAPRPVSRDGWWLLRAASDHARGGASSQNMMVWDADGRPVAAQMQSVAIFA